MHHLTYQMPTSLFLSLILTVSLVLRVTDGQALSFVLNGATYPNGSTVLRKDIGEGVHALNCTTDNTTCCTNMNGEIRAGDFYFPDGSKVLTSGSAPFNSYYRTRSSQLIGLNRRPNATQTGRFRCEIPDASGTRVNLFINIGDDPTTQTAASISLSITASGTNTAGKTYSLECSATVIASADHPNITWLDPINNTVPSEMVTITGSMSTLTFNPLAASHAGTYKCRVTAGGVTEMQTSTVIVNVITAQVTRSSNGPLISGQTGFSLSCDVTETENLNTPTFIYQWRRNGGVISDQQGSTLSLSPLTASNAGEYNCSVTVSSTSLSSTVTVNSVNTETVSIQLPAPTSVTVTNGSVNVGSTVTLTCTVELSPAVDVPVTVNTVWTGPDGFMTTNTAQRIGSTTTYTSTTIVSKERSGNYTCTATVGPNSASTYLAGSGVLSNTTSIVAPAPPPLNVQATQFSASAPVEVSWSPPSSGATNITGYRIFYGNGKNVLIPSVVSNIGLVLNKDFVGETVSVRSEAHQLSSQLITVTVTNPPALDAVTKSPVSCVLQVGITFGVTLLTVCLVAIVVVFIYLWRRRVGKNELDQSTNMPTQLYEDPDKLTSRGQGNYELTQCAAYESTTTKPHPPPRTQAEVDQSSHYEL